MRIGNVLASIKYMFLLEGKFCIMIMIIDGGSRTNLASEELVEKFNTKTKKQSVFITSLGSI